MSVGKKVKVYMDFTKFRLSALVILSALSGYLFVVEYVTWEKDGLRLIWLMLGGFLVTAASNGSNQIWERELDILMKRTAKRPLPMKTMTVNEGVAVVSVFLVAGLIMLYQLNLSSMVLGLAAYISYVFIYTPMKRVTSWAVFVGAFPGAIPPMLGAIAATDDGEFGLVPGVLFFVQFVWQFPHFWAIAWVAHDDYKAGGFHLLPSESGRSKSSAFQIAAYSLALIPFTLLPWLMNWTGIATLIIGGLASVLFFLQSYKLYVSCELVDAKKLMFASFIFLPVVQFLYVFDRNPLEILAYLAGYSA